MQIVLSSKAGHVEIQRDLLPETGKIPLHKRAARNMENKHYDIASVAAKFEVMQRIMLKLRRKWDFDQPAKELLKDLGVKETLLDGCDVDQLIPRS